MMRNIVLIWKESRVIPWLFSLSWEQRKVADIASDTRGGGTPTTSNEAYWSGDIPWIQSSDLTEGIVFGVKPRKHISKSGLNSSATQLVPENSIAVVTRVGVGKLAEGMHVDEVIERLEGIPCGFKKTSCPDQLAQALKEYKQDQ